MTAASLGAFACTSSAGDELARAVVGLAGGTIAGGGWTLEIPAGALTADTEIVLRSAEKKDLSARDFEQVGAAVVFEPANLALRLPAALRYEKPPETAAILFEQDERTVAAIGATAYLNELAVASVASAGTVTATVEMPALAATPQQAEGEAPVTDRARFELSVAPLDVPTLVLVLTAYDPAQAYEKPLNGDGKGDCAFAFESVSGGSLALGCSGDPASGSISTSSDRVSFDAVPFQAGKLETPIVVGVVAGGDDLAFLQGFFRFDTGPCFGETCSGHGTCVVDGDAGRCECESGYEPQGLACACIPQCDGRVCGGDSCGGSCPPGCGTGEMCEDGQCVPDGSTSTSTSTSGGSSTGSTSGGSSTSQGSSTGTTTGGSSSGTAGTGAGSGTMG